MKMNKKKLIILGSIIAVLILVITCLIMYFNVTYQAPLEALKKQDKSLSRQTLMKLETAYTKKLEEKHLTDQKITYYEKTNMLNDRKYSGNFISKDGYVYEFTFDLDTLEVKLIEYSKQNEVIKFQVESSNYKEENTQ